VDQVGKPSGLTRRKGSAAWYYRQRVPERFRRVGGPAEVWISLKTSEYRAAISKLDWARQQAQLRFAAIHPQAESRRSVRSGIVRRAVRADWPIASGRPPLTAELAAPLARAYFAQAMRGLDLEPRISKATDPVAFNDQIVELEDRLARLHDATDEADHSYGAKVWALDHAGVQTSYTSDECQLLGNYLDRALIQIATMRLARLHGDYTDRITDSLFLVPDVALPPAATPDREQAASDGMALDPTLVDLWAKERAVSPKGIAKHRAVARWFAERAGDLRVQQITKRDVLKFKNAMIDEGVTAANANAKLSCLRTLLGYAVENALLDANPADRVNVLDKDKDRRKRKEFDLATLTALFASPVYAADERPMQGRGEAAYWLPLIALYTGARLEEIAQLRPEDVREETYIDGDDQERRAWVIQVMQVDDLTTKNASSERRVPVHPDLASLGFVAFAKDAIAARQPRLFPALKANLYGRLGAKWAEWWSRYRRDVCGIADRRIVFHSFRHTFKSYSRHVGMIEGVQRQIMGHSPGDTADEYGASRYSLHQLVEGMKLYRVPGLVLPSPPPAHR
jgi:integrase